VGDLRVISSFINRWVSPWRGSALVALIAIIGSGAIISLQGDQLSKQGIILILLGIAAISTLTIPYFVQRKIQALNKERDSAIAESRAKAEFLAHMSHEIRTPMNGILGLTALTLEGTLDAEQRSNLELVKYSGENLLRIINQILDFSKIESGKFILNIEACDFHALCDNVVRLLAIKAREKQVEILLEVDTDIPQWLKLDRVRFSQILTNIVGNSIKFTPDSGAVIIKVCRDSETSHLAVSVADSGIGISEHKIQSVFEPFTQAEDTTAKDYGGTGLGLTLSRQLVTLMGGTLTVKSKKGVGTLFQCTIPLIPASPPFQAPTNNAVAHTDQSSSREILLAEDNRVNQVFARRVLERSGFTVTIAENGAEALHIFKELDSSKHFSVILMDLQMPELDGFAATREIRALGGRGITIPIIALTANVLQEERDRARDAGMNDFVTKPFKSEELLERIHLTTASAPTVHHSPENEEKQ
jgi:signal transduction histidine kinase/FixJ family two-component response regulator